MQNVGATFFFQNDVACIFFINVDKKFRKNIVTENVAPTTLKKIGSKILANSFEKC
jgi:hypothetical protein